AHVSPDGPRYFGGTFLPFNALPPRRATLLPPTTAIALSILSNCFSNSARRLRRVSSTRFRRSMSVSTVIPDRLTFGMVASCLRPRQMCPPSRVILRVHHYLVQKGKKRRQQ